MAIRDLSDNKLTEFPSVIFNMTNLNVLYVVICSLPYRMTLEKTNYLSLHATLTLKKHRWQQYQ